MTELAHPEATVETMSLDAVELVRIRIPLVTPFRTSFGTQLGRDVLLLRVMAGDVEGWGECVAMEEPLYNEEYVDGAERVIVEHLLPRVMKRADLRPEDVATAVAPVKGNRMAKAA